MPSSLTKGGRGPRNDKSGDRYDHNAFDQNLQDEIFQMTYASHELELRKKAEDQIELQGFRAARTQAALDNSERQVEEEKKSLKRDAASSKDKTKKKITPDVVLKVKTKKKKKKKKKRKREEEKKKEGSKKPKESGGLAGLLGGYASDAEDP
mmetsp:Transcript_5351/g.7889  ORF Transcript_5351/g.7889 Transcript_5351/m.7889 type:complete len:152 (+) Transcript_5351:100-555(+)